jgi:hypothetical protein
MITPSSTKYDVNYKNSKANKFLHNYHIEVLDHTKNAHVKVEKIISGVLHLITLFIYTPERGWTKEEYVQEVITEKQHKRAIKPIDVQYPIQKTEIVREKKEIRAQAQVEKVKGIVIPEKKLSTPDEKLSSIVEDLQQFSLDPSTFGDQTHNTQEKEEMDELISFIRHVSQAPDFELDKWSCGYSKTQEFDMVWFEHVSRRKTFIYMIKEVNEMYLTERLQKAKSGSLIGYTIVTPQTIRRNFFKNTLLKLFIEWKKENGYVVTEKELKAVKLIK